MTRQKPSSRAYEHATISFGLVTIPVDVFTSTVSDHGIKRSQFIELEQELESGETLKVDHPVGNGAIDKVSGELIDRSLIVKKIATENGYVFVEDHEIEQLFSVNPKTIEVKAFQPQTLFYQGHYIPNGKFWCVEATKTKVGTRKVDNAPAQTALAMLLKAMREEGAMALVEFTTRGTPRPAVLLPDGTLWGVYHDDELREQRPLPDIEINEQIVAQGRMLVQSLWETNPVDLTDHRTALIQGLADEKAAAGDFSKPEDVAVAEPDTKGADDLMALLAASVEQAKETRAAGEAEAG